jgi:hypothetical protein
MSTQDASDTSDGLTEIGPGLFEVNLPPVDITAVALKLYRAKQKKAANQAESPNPECEHGSSEVTDKR